MSAVEACELDREEANRTGASMHQNSFAGLQFCAIQQPLPCSQRGNGDRGRRLVSESGGIACDLVRLRQAELGRRPLANQSLRP